MPNLKRIPFLLPLGFIESAERIEIRSAPEHYQVMRSANCSWRGLKIERGVP